MPTLVSRPVSFYMGLREQTLTGIWSPQKGSPAAEAQKTIHLKSIVNEAEEVYGEEEKMRKEGLLWVDRKSSRFIVTLGALNGVNKGSYLTIYDGDKKVGQAKVESAFDVISYVSPLEKSLNLSTKDYYRVVVE